MGWRKQGVAFLAGGASVLAYAPFELFPVAALALGALFWLLGPGAPWCCGGSYHFGSKSTR